MLTEKEMRDIADRHIDKSNDEIIVESLRLMVKIKQYLKPNLPVAEVVELGKKICEILSEAYSLGLKDGAVSTIEFFKKSAESDETTARPN